MDGYDADAEIVPFDGGGGDGGRGETKQAIVPVADVDPLGEEERRKTMNERIAKIQRERDAKNAAKAEKAIAEKGIARGPGGQFSLVVDRSSSGLRNQDPRLALSLLPECLEHFPDLLGTVYIAPATSVFTAVWSVLRQFLSERTAAKFVLIAGADWREQLREAVGDELALPAHMRPAAASYACVRIL